MSLSLQELKNRRLVWSANQAPNHIVEPAFIPSGFAVLDEQIGGWPNSGLVELQPSAMGVGELRLILPVLASLASKTTDQAKLQVWLPGGVQLMPQGLGAAFTSSTVMLKSLSSSESLWVLDTLLQSGICSAVVCWLDALDPAQAKRLQIAAKESNTLVFCIRSMVRQDNSLPISLRMRLQPSDQGLLLDVFKRQNAYAVEPFQLNLSKASPELYRRQKISDAHAYQHNVISFPSTHSKG